MYGPLIPCYVLQLAATYVRHIQKQTSSSNYRLLRYEHKVRCGCLTGKALVQQRHAVCHPQYVVLRIQLLYNDIEAHRRMSSGTSLV